MVSTFASQWYTLCNERSESKEQVIECTWFTPLKIKRKVTKMTRPKNCRNARERRTEDEFMWETLETLSSQGVAIGQQAINTLTGHHKNRKRDPKGPRNLEDFD